MLFNYRNEAMFSNAFCKALRNHNWFVQRIETGTTGKGVPDVYAISPNGIPFWFELKRVHQIVTPLDFTGIPWRPGQQAWLMTATHYQQRCYTIACCNNALLKISHEVFYPSNRVHTDMPGVEVYDSILELIK